ncbi:MAG: hypothetical protein HQ402_02355 [Parcubacteria group bacterium]|nr:hypothetical protein [Parcubacteria group bacterium]
MKGNLSGLIKKIFIVLILVVIGFGVYLFSNNSILETNLNLEAFINTNSDSNVAIVVKATNGEAIIGFTNEEKILDKVVLTMADERSALISVDSLGRPITLEFEGAIATFNNYTDHSVDITVHSSNGKTEVYKNSAITKEGFSFIQKALAMPVSEFLSYLSMTTNVVSCGFGIGVMAASVGIMSPISFLGCAQLTTRIVTRPMEISSCKGDYLECAALALREELQKSGPDFLKNGFRLKGGVNNVITGGPITDGVILVEDLSLGKKSRGNWMPDSYEIYFKDSGVYSVRLVAAGYVNNEFDIILTPTKAQIRLAGQKLDLNEDLEGKEYYEIETELFMNPDAFISGEVIDATEGKAVIGAEVLLLDGNTTVGRVQIDSDGIFNIQPTLNPTGKNFVLRISADGYKQKDIPLFISYNVKNKSDEYEIDNWNGVVKLEPSGKTDLTGVWNGQLESTRKDLRGNNMFICDQKNFVFRIYKLADGKVMLNGSLGKTSENTTEKEIGGNDAFYWKIDEKGNTTFSSGVFPAVGKLSGSSGVGTWTQMMKDWSTPAHEEYEICGGTWSALKVK